MNIREVSHGVIGLAKSKMDVYKAKDETIKLRRSICDTCPKKTNVPIDTYLKVLSKLNIISELPENMENKMIGRCAKCGCFINEKTMIRDEKCDDIPSRWGSEK